MKRFYSKHILAAMLATAVCSVLSTTVHGQGEDEVLVKGVPLENAIVERDIAFGLKAEVQITEDTDDLIDENPSYKRYPTEMYTGEATLYQKNRFTTGARYSRWHNEQDLVVDEIGWNVKLPLASGERIYGKFRHRGDERDPDRNYLYLGFDKTLAGQLYSYSQYRLRVTEGGDDEHQLSQYLSWRTPKSRFRAGTQFALSSESGAADSNPWYARLFSTYFLLKEWTSVRGEVLHYDYGSDLSFQEYKIYLYQKIGKRSTLRLGARYYDDDADLESVAFDIKARHFFSTGLAVHLGYRFYDHSEGADFDTFYGGVWALF